MCDNENCESKKLISIHGHCVDRFTADYNGVEYGPHYVPGGLGIGPTEIGSRNGDDIQLRYCAVCGKIQGKFPLDPENLEELFKEPDIRDPDIGSDW